MLEYYRGYARDRQSEGRPRKDQPGGDLGAEFAAAGMAVAFVDLDPQATVMTWILGRTSAPGTAEILLGEKEAVRVVIGVSAFGLGLIVAAPNAESSLYAQVASELAL